MRLNLELKWEEDLLVFKCKECNALTQNELTKPESEGIIKSKFPYVIKPGNGNYNRKTGHLTFLTKGIKEKEFFNLQKETEISTMPGQDIPPERPQEVPPQKPDETVPPIPPEREVPPERPEEQPPSQPPEEVPPERPQEEPRKNSEG